MPLDVRPLTTMRILDEEHRGRHRETRPAATDEVPAPRRSSRTASARATG